MSSGKMRQRDSGDGEILHRAGGVDAVIGIGGDFHLADRVSFGAGSRHARFSGLAASLADCRCGFFAYTTRKLPRHCVTANPRGATMDRRTFIRSSGAAAAALPALAAPAIAQQAPEIKWRMTSSFPKTLDILYSTAEQFAKFVAEATDNKFQIQVFPAGEIAPGAGGRQRGGPRLDRDVPDGELLLLGQGPRLRLRHRRALRPQCPPAECLDVSRRRHGADERLLCHAQSGGLPERQHGRADGRLVPQGDQLARGPEGPEVPHRAVSAAR